MKKFKVKGTVQVSVYKEVWANNEQEAYDKAYEQLDNLTEYVGNGSYDRLVGVENDGESVAADGMIEYDDIEELEDDPDYFECPKCGEECEVCEQDDGTTYYHCADCDTYYDEDGDEFYPDVNDAVEDDDE